MIRKIITINKDLCNGCGLCVNACHEGAIGLVNGKAKLLRDDYCDGLGDCLPACPTNAISFEVREAKPYNDDAVKANKISKTIEPSQKQSPCGCPSSKAVAISTNASKLSQWPIQIKLVSPSAPYFNNCNLLIAADCTAYAYANFHNDFMSNKITIIGCPKLDAVDYSEKLTQIFANNNIKSITITRMIVPCCGGIVAAVKNAIEESGKDIELDIVTINTDGSLM